MAESYKIQQQVHMRSLCSSDVPAIKLLCNQCFPIQYPDKWYEEIVSSEHFYSIAATIDHAIVAFIVCQVKSVATCNTEDQDIVVEDEVEDAKVAYILSLGVLQTYRRHGIASLLLDSFLRHLSSHFGAVKAVFLHVLATNSVAIRFYESRGFYQHAILPFYYCIEGQMFDGFSYVLYINGGNAPCSITECCRRVSRSVVAAYSVSSSIFSKVRSFSRRLLSHVLTASLRLA